MRCPNRSFASLARFWKTSATLVEMSWLRASRLPMSMIAPRKGLLRAALVALRDGSARAKLCHARHLAALSPVKALNRVSRATPESVDPVLEDSGVACQRKKASREEGAARRPRGYPCRDVGPVDHA